MDGDLGNENGFELRSNRNRIILCQSCDGVKYMTKREWNKMLFDKINALAKEIDKKSRTDSENYLEGLYGM